jgi:hypothetical protein
MIPIGTDRELEGYAPATIGLLSTVQVRGGD